MKQMYKLLLLLVGGLGIVTGCKRNETEILPADGGIAFYNASQLLRAELQQKNPVNRQEEAFILLNAPVPVKPDSLTHLPTQDFPYFALSVGGQQFYPVIFASTATPPWISYLRVVPGRQEIAFLKTDTTLAATTTVNAEKGSQTTAFLVDSLGIYQAFTANDANTPFKNGVSLRVVHAAPDAGPLAVKVNEQWLSNGWPYKTVSGFYELSIPDSLTSTLFRIQVSPAADTATVLGKAVLKADRLQSYTLILNGYLFTHAEVSALMPDFRLSIMRNK